ncbi:MAG: hypothetical protein K2G24_08015, partial [Muribaculaceae bacterium]|nr:hypothetical protein [Muribaculaceae bacterium]
MAQPIKESPELRGNDAVRFETLFSTPKPVSKEEKERVRKALKTAGPFYERNGFQCITESDKDYE